MKQWSIVCVCVYIYMRAKTHYFIFLCTTVKCEINQFEKQTCVCGIIALKTIHGPGSVGYLHTNTQHNKSHSTLLFKNGLLSMHLSLFVRISPTHQNMQHQPQASQTIFSLRLHLVSQ